jgi:hypothetical protein
MQIQSFVADIRVFTPLPQDKIFLDTNVWLWLTYTRLSYIEEKKPLDYQANIYPEFVEKAKRSNSTLFWCTHNLVEIAKIIEDVEYRLYKESTGNDVLKKKDFRWLPAWNKVHKEIESALGLIRNIGTEIPCAPVKSDELLSGIFKHRLDSYDVLMLETMRSSDLVKILSDDKDFCYVAGFTVFTANSRIIGIAKEQDREYTREGLV